MIIRYRLVDLILKHGVQRLAVCLIGSLLLFASCEQAYDPFDDGPVAASFAPSISDGTTDVSSTTRVTDNVWSGSEVVGIAAFDAASGTQLTSGFMQYKPDMGGTHVRLQPSNASNTIYYPTDGSEVTFTAFSPYTVPSGNVINLTLPNQAVSTDAMESLDFIHYKGTTPHSQEAPLVNLRFEHKMSRVVINMTRGSNYTSSIASSTVQLQGVYTAASCNVLTGAVTPSGSGNFHACRTNSAATAVTWQAIIAPQTSSSTPSATNRKLYFYINSTYHTVEIPHDFEGGKSYTYDFVFDAMGVTLTGSTVVGWDSGTVAWDGKYVIAPSANIIDFASGASTQTITIKTKGTSNKPTASRSTSDASVTGSPTWISTYSLGTGTTSGDWTSYTLTVGVTANTGTTTKIGYIHVSLEGLSVVVTVTQSSASTITLTDGDSNCFIVTPGGTIHFPVTRPIAQGTAASNATFTIEKLWDDTSGGAVASCSVSGTGSNAVFSVTAGSSPGNAVIAAKVGSTIVWSYHIWVTDYNPWQGAIYINTYNTNNNGSNFVFMDRNLGAIAAGLGTAATNSTGTHGLYYQWGRKDPFPSTLAPGATQPGGGSFTAVATSSTLGTVANAIKNPSVFYWGVSDSSYDWYYGGGTGVANRNNELWGHSGEKTIYDPCPVGWRVPKNSAMSTAASPWNGFTMSNGDTFNKGWTWGTNAVYPAAGHRHANTGGLTNAGTRGYCWAASPSSSSSTTGAHLTFHSSAVYVHANLDRASGGSLRCVKN